MRRTTIIIEDDENYGGVETYPANVPFSPMRRNNPIDNGWVGGRDICSTCPNRPGGPNNKSGACWCAIPSMYGPGRVTC